MRIGTAVPSAEELQAVPHHFIQSHSIHEELNAGSFERLALDKLEQLFKKHSTAVLVGGSGLYIKALCEGFDFVPEKNEELRNQLNQLFQEKGIEPLQEQLKLLDPEFFEQVDQKNPQRLIRALEVCLSTGKTYSSFRSNSTPARPFRIVKIGVDIPREQLYSQINQRVLQMMDAGLLKEAMDLYPYKHLNALQTVGYSELFDFFEEKCSLEEATEQIQQNTRNFAKRQMTWFNRDKEIHWLAANNTLEMLRLIEETT